MPFQYPRSIWHGISVRLQQGESGASVSAQTGICQGTLCRWKHQALVDAGMKDGIPSPDASDLVSAHKRIQQLEDELTILKAASALYDEMTVVPPKENRGRRRALRPRVLRPTVLHHRRAEQVDLLQTYLRTEPSTRAIRRAIVADYVCLIHRRSGGTYGWRRIKTELLDEYEMIVNRKLIMAVMIEHEIAGVPRASTFRNPLADKRTDTDLVNRIFTADGPNRLWLTDVTEHPTREGKVYCCVVLDCFARTAVSRSFSTINDTALVTQAQRNGKRDCATVMHSDHGANLIS